MTALRLNDLLALEGIDAGSVSVLLHSPREGALMRLMPSLVRTRRTAVEAYQATHSRPAERALSQGRLFVAAFVKASPEREAGRSRMLFIGIYRNYGSRLRSHAEIWAEHEIRWLNGMFGACAEFAYASPVNHWRWFDLQLTERLPDLQGRLVILARLTPSYVRRAERLDAPVAAIHEVGVFDTPPPPWREMVLSAAEVQEIPPGWAAELRRTRGIYLILDTRDGARYVGAAYGEENLLGRWSAHVAGERGVTVGLEDRDPSGFRFSILERVSPDMPAEELIALEQARMQRLHTRTHGRNR